MTKALDDCPWLRSYNVWSQLAGDGRAADAFPRESRDGNATLAVRSTTRASRYDGIHATRLLDSWSDAAPVLSAS